MKGNKPEQDDSGFPAKLAQPARRALTGAGYTQLEQLTKISEAELKELHGMGPKALGQLRDALAANGLSFAEGKKSEQAPEANPAIKRMAVLAGTWRTEISILLDSPTIIPGQTTIEWLEEGPFLIMRGSVEHPDFPISTAIIGSDDSNESYSMVYFDSRGVSRIYEMSLSKEEWKLWRESPDFSQRFTGRFSDDGNTITGFWEKSSDGSNWEHDFDLTYTRVK
ncbi:MAG TPA: hypothetical protein VJ183_03830 [Chloroflexia bacterium]|nr:hypothetical protein [Chloroflexia bacterium]